MGGEGGGSAAMERAQMMADLGMDRLFAITIADEPRHRVAQAVQQRTRKLDKARREDILAHAKGDKGEGIAAWHDPSLRDGVDAVGDRPEFADGQSHRNRLQEKMKQENWDRGRMGAGRGRNMATSSGRGPQGSVAQRVRAVSPPKASAHYSLGRSKGRAGPGSVPRGGPTLSPAPNRAPDPRQAGTVRIIRGRLTQSTVVPNTTQVQAAPVSTAAIASSLFKSGLLASTSSTNGGLKTESPPKPMTSSTAPALASPREVMMIKHYAGAPREELEQFNAKYPKLVQAVSETRMGFYRQDLCYAATPTSPEVKEYYNGPRPGRKLMLLEAIKAKDLVESGDDMAIREYCAQHCENSDLIDLAETMYHKVEQTTINKPAVKKGDTASALRTQASTKTPGPKSSTPSGFSSIPKGSCHVGEVQGGEKSSFADAFLRAVRRTWYPGVEHLVRSDPKSYPNCSKVIGDAGLASDGVWVLV